jgi:sodium/hydrogen antiporter
MVAKRASKTIVTAPMVFLGIGLLLSYSQVMLADDAEHMLHLVAEVSLIILLFLDAAKINLSSLLKEKQWPQRMLLIGLPVSIGLGFLVGIPFFPDLPLPVIALIAAIMAPTDAALGQAVVTNEKVPLLERQTLTAESGLNDGLALPVILLFSCMVASMAVTTQDQVDWLVFAGMQVTLGPLVGIFAGWVGAKALLYAEDKLLTEPIYEGVATLAMAGSAYLAATLIGGNGFIAAFVAGLVFGQLVKGHCRFIYEFTESEGQMLVWTSFLFIGIGLLPEALHHLSLSTAAYIVLSLFIVRPVAIYLSLIGTTARPVTRLFFGCFGPRGLATALFALLVTKEIGHDYAHSVIVVSINAVWISALLHGISAVPGANWYARKVAKVENTQTNPVADQATPSTHLP